MASSRSLGSLTLDLIANIGGFTRALDSASRRLDDRLSAMERRAYEFGRVMGEAIRIGFTLFLGKNVISGIKDTIQAIDELGKAAQKVGLPVEQFSALASAAQLSNVGIDALVPTLGKFTANIAKATNAASEQAQIFKALGISIRDQNGNLKSSTDLMLAFSDQFKQLGVNSTTTAAGIALFGKSFQDMIPFLSQGSDGIKAAQDEAIALGAVLGGQATEAAAHFEDNLSKISLAAAGMRNQLVQLLLPALEAWTGDIVDLAENHDALNSKLVVLVNTVKVLEVAALSLENVFAVIADEARWIATNIGEAVAKAGAIKDFSLTRVGSLDDIKKAAHQFSITWKAAGEAADDAVRQSFDAMTDDVSKRTERIKGLINSMSDTTVASPPSKQIVELSEKIDGLASGGARGAKELAHVSRQIAALGAAAIKSGQDVEQVQSVVAAGIAKLQQTVGSQGKLTALQAALNPSAAQQADKLASALEALGNAVAKVNESSDPQQKAYNTYADAVRNLDQLGAKAIKAGANVKYVQDLVAQGVAGAQSKLQHDLQAPVLAAQAYKDALDQQLEAQKAANDAAVQAVGIGSQQAQEQQQLNKVLTDGAQAVANFTKRHADAIAQGDPQYTKELADLKQYWADVLKVTQDGQAALHDAQSNWLNGVNKAWDDFVTQQNNTAQIAGQLTTDFLTQGSDAFASFIDGTKSAKDALTDFIDSFEQEITQAVSKQLLRSLFSIGGSDGTMSGNGSGGWLSTAANWFGSLFSHANGGTVARGSVSRVNERGPELLSVGGRDYLMMGGQSGRVTPNSQLSRGGTTQNNNFYLAAPTSQKTQTQIANKLSYQQRQAARLS